MSGQSGIRKQQFRETPEKQILRYAQDDNDKQA
jgi:hypothetical protein